MPPETPYCERYGSNYYLPWQFEVESAINTTVSWFTPETDDMRMLAAVDYDTDDNTLYGVVCIQLESGTWVQNIGRYHVALIARAVKYRHLGIGDMLLTHALYACWQNHSRFGRPLVVHTLIDYRNEPSIRLFERHGFERVEHRTYIDDRYAEYVLAEDSPEWETFRD